MACCMVFVNSHALLFFFTCGIVNERSALGNSPFFTLHELNPFEQYHVVMNGIHKPQGECPIRAITITITIPRTTKCMYAQF